MRRVIFHYRKQSCQLLFAIICGIGSFSFLKTFWEPVKTHHSISERKPQQGQGRRWAQSGFDGLPKPLANWMTHNYSNDDWTITPETKTILWWTKLYKHSKEDRVVTGIDARGKRVQCFVTSDKALVDKASAVIFFASRQTATCNFPKSKPAGQMYVLNTKTEPPPHLGILRCPAAMLDGLFNWVASIVMDSDFNMQRNRERAVAYAKISSFAVLNSTVMGKTKMAAWFVSNCHPTSERERYVDVLRNHIELDIYGKCGEKTHSCWPSWSQRCYDVISRDYLFYLAFENSVCDYYVTEKLWQQGMQIVIPVVLKRSVVAPFLPSEAFIAVDDFKTPWHLAQYMKYLAGNRTAYLERLRWRLSDHLNLTGLAEGTLEEQICSKLHSGYDPTQSYSYQDIARGLDPARCYPGFIDSVLPPDARNPEKAKLAMTAARKSAGLVSSVK